MAETRLELQIAANSQAAIQSLDSLLSAMNRIRGAVSKGFNVGDAGKSIGQIATTLETALKEETVQRYQRMADALKQISANSKINIQIGNGVSAATQQVQAMKETLQAMDSGVTTFTGGESPIGKNAAEEADRAAEATHRYSDALRNYIKAANSAKRSSGGLLSSFIRIAKYRFLRAVLREIVEGITTGVKNMYGYAKAIGLSFAPAVDSAKDALLRMKNSIGAALAPAIEMLIPYLIQAVEWFINLLNVVNQFLALLNGQTEWTRAISATSDAMDDVKDSAGGAAKAIKEAKGLLADWDELNIIQQQPTDTGSGSGSGKKTKEETDYTTMFEQVSVFDGTIRDVVDWLKENMESVKRIAKDIGLVIAGWTISNALGGIIGTLAGWATTGLIAKLVFDGVLLFDGNYLDSHNPAWLLGDILTTALGAGIASKLITGLTGSAAAGFAAASFVILFSATANIATVLGNVDTNALSQENLTLAIIAGLKGFAAAGLFAKSLGASNGQAITFGLGALATVFGVTVGIKALLGIADTSEITGENMWALIVSALTTGAGALFIAHGAGATWPMASWIAAGVAGGVLSVELGIAAILSDKAADTSGINWQGIMLSLSSGLAAAGATIAITKGVARWTIGESLLAGAAVGALVLAVELGVSAVVSTAKANTDGVTTEAIIKSVTGGLLAMGAVAAVSKYAGWTMPQAIGYGIGAAGLFIAVALGVNAIVGTVNAKKLTTNNVLAALGATAGAGIGTAAILAAGGASLGVAAAVGGGVALATGLVIAAAIAIALEVPERGGVKWGNEKLTDEQVQTFVSTKMFTADAKTKINLIDSKVDASETELANLKTQTADLLSTINAVTLGIDDKSTMLEIHKQVQNVVKATELYAQSQTAVLRTGISVVPVINEAGEDISAEILAKGITGWQGVTDYMTDLGKQLSNAMIDGTTGEMKKDWDSELVKTILDKLSNVSRAVNEAQVSGTVRGELGQTVFGLSDLSKESFDSVIKSYNDYADKMKTAMYNVYYQEVSTFEQLAAYYNAMAENEAGTEKGAQYAKLAEDAAAEAKRLAGLMDKSVQDALDRELAYGKSMITDWLVKMFTDNPITEKDINNPNVSMWATTLLGANFSKEGFKTFMSNVTGIPIDVMDILDITGWEYLSEETRLELYNAMKKAFGINGIPVDNLNLRLESVGIEIPDNAKFDAALQGDDLRAFESALDQAIFVRDQIQMAQDRLTLDLIPEIPDDAGEDIEEQLDEIIGDNGVDFEVDYDTSALEPPAVIPAVDTSNFTDSVATAVTDVSSNIAKTVADTVTAIDGEIDYVCNSFIKLRGLIPMTDNFFYYKMKNMPKPAKFASGGFPETGDYFLARESGPELVGKMGNRTAVANNDQIVAGIASGVAAAQQEQNTLLRQQNDYLRRLLAKESTVRVEPSSKWGKFNRQSEAMYAKNTGTGV